MRSLWAVAFACAVTMSGAAHGAHAATAPAVALSDGSVRYAFGRRPAPVLVCATHHVCDIALDSGESVLNMAIGDATRWVIAGGQSGPGGTTPHVFVRPAAANLDSNLVITTTKRVYDVALRSTNTAPSGRISFFYADEDAAAKAAIAAHAVDVVLAGTPSVGADAADAKYRVSGDTSIVPARVFNDGVRTFIEWKALPLELPAVVSIGKDGAAQPVDFRVVGTRYIVDGLDPNYDLVLAAAPDKHGRPERRAAIRHL